MSEHVVSRKVYVTIFLLLMLLTAITVAVAFLDLGPFNTLAAMGIACIKATLIVLYFMHARYGSRLILVFVVTGVLWLGVLVALTMSDYVSRGWLPIPGAQW